MYFFSDIPPVFSCIPPVSPVVSLYPISIYIYPFRSRSTATVSPYIPLYPAIPHCHCIHLYPAISRSYIPLYPAVSHYHVPPPRPRKWYISPKIHTRTHARGGLTTNYEMINDHDVRPGISILFLIIYQRQDQIRPDNQPLVAVVGAAHEQKHQLTCSMRQKCPKEKSQRRISCASSHPGDRAAGQRIARGHNSLGNRTATSVRRFTEAVRHRSDLGSAQRVRTHRPCRSVLGPSLRPDSTLRARQGSRSSARVTPRNPIGVSPGQF